jgi:hypothetical protein
MQWAITAHFAATPCTALHRPALPFTALQMQAMLAAETELKLEMDGQGCLSPLLLSSWLDSSCA